MKRPSSSKSPGMEVIFGSELTTGIASLTISLLSSMPSLAVTMTAIRSPRP